MSLHGWLQGRSRLPSGTLTHRQPGPARQAGPTAESRTSIWINRCTMEPSLPGGVLFTDPSADQARLVFAKKPRSLCDKLTTVADAVRNLVHDGDYLAVGGFGSVRIPTAILHEILRQRKQDLGL